MHGYVLFENLWYNLRLAIQTIFPNFMKTNVPLVVDLDGTLLRSDLLIETGLLFLKNQPLGLLDLIRWTVGGKALLKTRLAESTEVDVTVLPYNSTVLDFIREQRTNGRTVVLATASHERIARQVADYLSLFDDIIGTNLGVNLS